MILKMFEGNVELAYQYSIGLVAGDIKYAESVAYFRTQLEALGTPLELTAEEVADIPKAEFKTPGKPGKGPNSFEICNEWDFR